MFCAELLIFVVNVLNEKCNASIPHMIKPVIIV